MCWFCRSVRSVPPRPLCHWDMIPARYWRRGPRSQEASWGAGAVTRLMLHCHHQNDRALRCINVSWTVVRGKSASDDVNDKTVGVHKSHWIVQSEYKGGEPMTANKLNRHLLRLSAEFRSCVKVEVAVLDSPSYDEVMFNVLGCWLTY